MTYVLVVSHPGSPNVVLEDLSNAESVEDHFVALGFSVETIRKVIRALTFFERIA